MATWPRASWPRPCSTAPRCLAVEGNFDDALRIVRELSEKHPIALVNSLNPFRLEGQKTAAFEVV